MERKTALMVSIVVSASLVLGATAFAVSLATSDRSVDNVGNLQPVATDLTPSTQPAPPAEVTVYVDPLTGLVSNTPSTSAGQPAVVPAPTPVPTPGVAAVAPSTNAQGDDDGYDDRGSDDDSSGDDGYDDDSSGDDGYDDDDSDDGESHERGDDDD